MNIVAFIGGFVIGCWFTSNAAGWWVSPRTEGYPWNWRVFLGPWAYEKWLKRRGQQ